MKLYNGLLTAWIEPWAGTRTLQQVAKDRKGATTLVNKTMTGPDGVLLSHVRRGACRGMRYRPARSGHLGCEDEPLPRLDSGWVAGLPA
jgi:hypothetical protein